MLLLKCPVLCGWVGLEHLVCACAQYGTVIGMFVFDIFLYLFIGFWLDRVVASDFGGSAAGSWRGPADSRGAHGRRIATALLVLLPQAQLLLRAVPLGKVSCAAC